MSEKSTPWKMHKEAPQKGSGAVYFCVQDANGHTLHESFGDEDRAVWELAVKAVNSYEAFEKMREALRHAKEHLDCEGFKWASFCREGSRCAPCTTHEEIDVALSAADALEREK